MSFLGALDISASALTAQRLQMDIISENIANAATTRTAGGGPYRRKVVILSERTENSFDAILRNAAGIGTQAGKGVVVSSIEYDNSPFIVEYDPDNPDADADGYVTLPNVDEAEELIDLIATTRAYEANITVLNAIKGMAMKALEIKA
jgi:flagellar basal-body rod protein FlgC